MNELDRRSFVKLAVAVTTRPLSAGGAGQTVFTVLNPRSYQAGAGLCVVIRTPAGKTCLFDTGVGNGERDNGTDIILPWLKKQGISVLDGVIISHYHGDHFGGLRTLCREMTVRKIFNNNFNPPDDAGRPRFDGEGRICRATLDAWSDEHPGCLVEDLRVGTDLGWDEPGVSFEVVWPPEDRYIQELKNRQGYTVSDTVYHHLLNGNSNALRVTVGKRVFFIVGDIQPDYLKQYMLPYLRPQGKWGCDVCLLPSHGTAIQQALPLIGQMDPKPKTVVASLGDRRWMFGCGRACKDHWGRAGYTCYSTNLDGDLTFTFADDTWTEVNDASHLFPEDA